MKNTYICSLLFIRKGVLDDTIHSISALHGNKIHLFCLDSALCSLRLYTKTP